jgi:hypothetical protein
MEKTVDPQVQLQNTIRTQSRNTGVNVEAYNPGSVKTNEFFEEHTMVIPVTSVESNLVSFLYAMGNDPAMIRVAKLDLRPAEQARYHLHGSITLTANYARAAAAKVAAGAAPKPAVAAAKPGPSIVKQTSKPVVPPPSPRANPAPPRPGGNPAPSPSMPPNQKRVPPQPGAPNPKPSQRPHKPGQNTSA